MLALAVYHVGSPAGWSSLFYFTAMKAGSDWSPRFAVFGDMGNKNAQSLGRIQEEVQRGHFDALLHVGRCMGLSERNFITVSLGGLLQAVFKRYEKGHFSKKIPLRTTNM